MPTSTSLAIAKGHSIVPEFTIKYLSYLKTTADYRACRKAARLSPTPYLYLLAYLSIS